MEDAELKKVLSTHKAEIEDAHAQYSALEAVVMGFFLAMQRRGTPTEVFIEAFDYAAELHVLNASLHPGVLQTTRSLEVVEDLRKAVIPQHRAQ